jgi:superfamily II DNA or RNA helicase
LHAPLDAVPSLDPPSEKEVKRPFDPNPLEPKDRRARKELVEAIAKEEARLADLDVDRSAVQQRLLTLRQRPAAAPMPQTIHAPLPDMPGPSVPRTPAEKVTLFRQLFRGRADVFPTRFVSKRTGKPGYAPACANKFVPGLCELPRIKCGDCRHQAFTPVSDTAVLDHLQGRHVMGLYPLLEDETCWLLAVDFDKGTWVEDVSAFIATCRNTGLPAAVERSRSGNGAHVWFFFASPVAASAARRMACYLLTETMSQRYQISMDSYDRLFPSQDTMPRGGFGNLIALPLQHGPRQHGNSVFLDERFEAYPGDEQWSYLASIQRIEPSTVERIANEATRLGSVVGLRSVDIADEESATPWMRQPSRRQPVARIKGPLPERAHAILAQKLFVDKTGLPSTLLNRLKRLAAFQNPEFYKRQAMRLSTARTPRVVACAEDLPQHIGLPRGCVNGALALMAENGITLEIDDKRCQGRSFQYRFKGRLSKVQAEAARALLEHSNGVFVAPPGSGKTVVGAYMVAERACSTLILVHRRPLLDQWTAQLALFLGIDAKEIGQIGAGKQRPNGRLDVAMIQSLVRKGQVDDVVATYGQVIVDECHHIPAVSFERVLAEVRARHLVGLTATPQRRDGHHPISEMQLGPIRFAVSPKSQAAGRPFSHRLIVRNTTFKVAPGLDSPTIQDLYSALAKDESRNQLILADVVQSVKENRSPLVLTERKDHVDYFVTHLRKTCHVVTLHGGMGDRMRRTVKEQLATTSTKRRVIVATGRYVGEGFDDARLDTLFLALPVSWKGTLVQYAGRLHRLHPGKVDVRVFDYVDRDVPMMARMFAKRLRGYRAIGYTEGDFPSVQVADLGVDAAQGAWPIDSPFHGTRLEPPPDGNNNSATGESSSRNEIDLEEMVKEATIDCYGEAEQATGLFMMMQDSLAVPFETSVNGATLTVERLDLGAGDQILAICTRNAARCTLPIADVPLPSPPPIGGEWIEAYRYWLGGV